MHLLHEAKLSELSETGPASTGPVSLDSEAKFQEGDAITYMWYGMIYQNIKYRIFYVFQRIGMHTGYGSVPRHYLNYR